MIFQKKRRPRVCVIGLDGVPYSLLLELSRRGVMPAMARLIEAGHLHRLRASLPEISAVSWSDFMTGKDSGTHGIFGFSDLKPNSYALRFPNYTDLRADPIWQTLGRRGKTCVVINQPSTYPARPLNGVMISGFVALDLARAVYPPAILTPLKRMGYRVDIDTVRARQDPNSLWPDLDETLAGWQKALEYFWKEDWDYFEFVLTGTDRLHHFFWKAWEDDAHPAHSRFLDYYRRIDDILKWIVNAFTDRTGGDIGLYLLSDHGFCRVDREVYLNAWLEKEGYLRFSVPSPSDPGDIAEGSLAFALDPGRIYLHLKGRFPKGMVEENERPRLKKQIAQQLSRLEFEGKPVIRHVFEADAVYSGPLVPLGPDLLVVPVPGFDLKGSFKKKEIFGPTDFQGMHTWDDAFFWSRDRRGEELAIRDLAGLILEDFPGFHG